jgi:hypothetical protein
VAYQAIQSFSAEFGDGRPAQAVNKGEIFPDGHELVRRDLDESGGRQPGQLFKKLNLGEEEPPPASAPKAEAPAAAKAPARGKAAQ